MLGPGARSWFVRGLCVFRVKVDTDCMANWTVIPEQTALPFHRPARGHNPRAERNPPPLQYRPGCPAPALGS